MLAPIVTKEMRLFPSQKLPPCVKNVRSRAQSLDHFKVLQDSGSARGRIVPVRPRISVSTGSLPSASSARSPPKALVHRKTTLSAIQEGVEMTSNGVVTATHSRSESSSIRSAASRQSRKALKGCGKSPGESTSDSQAEKKKGGILKWLSNAFRRSSKALNRAFLRPATFYSSQLSSASRPTLFQFVRWPHHIKPIAHN